MENSPLQYFLTVHVITLSVLEYTSDRTFLLQNTKELTLNADKICVTYCLTVVSVLDTTLIVVILMCDLSMKILDKQDRLSTPDTKSIFMQHESQTVTPDILFTY
jgi:hypothetical protein